MCSANSMFFGPGNPPAPKIMGIINITPNSFSDGGAFFDVESLGRRVQEHYAAGVQVVDFGAESTAPFNSSLTWEEEMERIERVLFPYLSQGSWPAGLMASLDTYHPETFLRVAKYFQRLYPGVPLIWNDVSGVWDEATWELLQQQDLHFTYVHNWTQVPRRDLMGQHASLLSSLQGEEFLQSAIEHFQGVREKLSTISRTGRPPSVIFDPGFGFSKTREQNITLARDLKKLIRSLPDGWPWLLGISRKSFLREPNQTRSREQEVLEQAERLHTYLLAKWRQEMPQTHFIFRVHEPKVALMAERMSREFPFVS